MKLNPDPGIHIVMHSVRSLKLGVAVYIVWCTVSYLLYSLICMYLYVTIDGA
jgi:hypothetical protein